MSVDMVVVITFVLALVIVATIVFAHWLRIKTGEFVKRRESKKTTRLEVTAEGPATSPFIKHGPSAVKVNYVKHERVGCKMCRGVTLTGERCEACGRKV